MQNYPQWKIYFSIGLVTFTVGGAVLVYFDAQKKEEMRTKIGQMERMQEVANKEKEKQESLTRDATDRARLLAEQLRLKTEEIAKVLKDKPRIEGEITRVRLFPWQRASASRTGTDEMATAMGVLVFAHLRNDGSSTTLANWELSIQLPDNTIVKGQEWRVQSNMRIPCEDGPINISQNESLEAKREPLHKTGDRSGVTVWMVKGVSLLPNRTKDSFYTLTVRDESGMVHALERYKLVSLPEKCFGFVAN